MKCENLPTVKSGILTVASDGQTSVASYECFSGYKLVGSSTRICETTGSWNGEEPVCSRSKYIKHKELYDVNCHRWISSMFVLCIVY